jgi:hypothetical protein
MSLQFDNRKFLAISFTVEGLSIRSSINSLHSLSYYISITSSKRVLHSVWHSASSFDFQYPRDSSRSSNSCLRLLSRLPVTNILPYTFPSLKCYSKEFLRNMWPIQLMFLLYIICRIFFSFLTLCDTSSCLTISLTHISPSFSSITLQNFSSTSD